MRRSNFALRLQPSLMEEARKIAESEGVALNQLINVAVAEKISALRTAEYFQSRAQRANREETVEVLARAGRRNPPIDGDELPSKQTRNGSSRAKTSHANGSASAKRRARN